MIYNNYIKLNLYWQFS